MITTPWSTTEIEPMESSDYPWSGGQTHGRPITQHHSSSLRECCSVEQGGAIIPPAVAIHETHPRRHYLGHGILERKIFHSRLYNSLTTRSPRAAPPSPRVQQLTMTSSAVLRRYTCPALLFHCQGWKTRHFARETFNSNNSRLPQPYTQVIHDLHRKTTAARHAKTLNRNENPTISLPPSLPH